MCDYTLRFRIYKELK